MKKCCKVNEYTGEEEAFFRRINVLIKDGWKVVNLSTLPADHSGKATLRAEMEREIPEPMAEDLEDKYDRPVIT